MNQVSTASAALPLEQAAPGRGMRMARAMLVLLGAAGLAWGAWVLVDTVRVARLPGVALWVGAAIVVHDAVIAPLVFFGGVLLRRAGRRRAGVVVAVVQGTIVLGSIMTLIVVPEIVAQTQGQAPKNPTVLPLDYGLNLAVFWLVIAVGATAASAVLYARTRRAGRRPAR
ncbi:hypothetical protein RCH16_003284 [Cryobacterium sp. MP_M5]|uniref:hypothetical protein n=1 Tax=unclassified Cryobacterium TaxID=2649013 RepID=UPI0018CA5A3A|nr:MULTISPECIES: hypothetical protein [unclassified Cryobacterium]MBG6058494.1 hypothetical protein [Cryobacterium sp. MP_M3]MEC5178246.1 hypothetical protein [Cryobacterium sp. MP_M5]